MARRLGAAGDHRFFFSPLGQSAPLTGPGQVWVVDGLFGIGLNRELSAGWRVLIEEINVAAESRRLRVVSVDVPSGLMNDAGESAGAMLVAELMSHDIPSTLTVNNYFGVLQGVLNHLGIGVLPDYITEDFPHLVRVLPETESSDVPVFLAYPEELRHSKRVSAFRDFVTEEIFTYRKRQQV